jgi:hypothetical protein
MRRPRLSPRGRIRASEERSAQFVPRQCGHAPGLKGELGEVAFMHKAVSLGFALAIPYGHIHRYDFIVESGTKLWRVQVKTTTVKARGMYNVTICRHANRERHAYTEAEIDFVAVYIVPEDTWYILPVREVVGHMCLRFRPKGYARGDIHDYYREAWHLLREPDGLVFG